MGITYTDMEPDDNCKSRERPEHDGALNPGDLVPGLWIDVVGAAGTAGAGIIRYVVLNHPGPCGSDPGISGQWVRVLTEDVALEIGLDQLSRYQNADPAVDALFIAQELSLEDMGVEPDDLGLWHTWYHTVRSDEQTATDLA